MNQMTMNQIAMSFLRNQSHEVSSKIKQLLAEDAEERIHHVDGPVLHHIHNHAIFEVLLQINALFTQGHKSEDAVREYLKQAEPLKSQFFDIVDALKNFEPSAETGDDAE